MSVSINLEGGDLVTRDDKLRGYCSQRDSRRTGEPNCGVRMPGAKPIFVVHKRDGSSLHYDLRLEVDGVLKSWVVPKGPSTDPTKKRLAVPAEDRPLDYAEFEGVVPESEYGAGPVMVWDAGTYRNLRSEEEGDGASMEESLAEGKVKVWLDGEKIKGGYVLICAGIRDDADWFLFKRDDEGADAGREPVNAEPASVISGKTLEEIEEEGREGK